MLTVNVDCVNVDCVNVGCVNVGCVNVDCVNVDFSYFGIFVFLGKILPDMH